MVFGERRTDEAFEDELFLGNTLDTCRGRGMGLVGMERKRWEPSLIVSSWFFFSFWVYLDFMGRSIYQCIAWETKTWSFREHGRVRESDGDLPSWSVRGSFCDIGILEGMVGYSSRGNNRGLYGVPAIYPNESTPLPISALYHASL